MSLHVTKKYPRRNRFFNFLHGHPLPEGYIVAEMKKRNRIAIGFWLGLWWLMMLPVAEAQNGIPAHPVDGTFVAEWLLLGPFFPGDLTQDFLMDARGEADIFPNAGDRVISTRGDTLIWKRYRSPENVVDLLSAVGQVEQAAAYAFCILQSDSAGQYQMLLGSDDGAAVWINGRRVHYNSAGRALFLDQDIFAAELSAGANRCLVKITQGFGEWRFTLRARPPEPLAGITPQFYIAAHELATAIELTNDLWKYHPGDNPAWANPEVDDSAWEFLHPALNPNMASQSRWEGAGWFRLHIAIDTALMNRPLGLSIRQAGVSHIYLDGKLIYVFGENRGDWSGMPRVLTFDRKQHHVLAVRYSNLATGKFHHAGANGGFFLQLGDLNQMTEARFYRERTFLGYQMFFTALPLAIGLLHLILFIFLPGLRQNLFFALFLFFYAATIYFDYQMLLSTDIEQELLSFRLHCAMLPFWVLFQLRFVYSLFYRELPRPFWMIAMLALFLGALAVYQPERNFGYFGIVYIVTNIEIIRVMIMAIYRKKEGAWIIAMAFLVFFFFGALDTLMDRGIITIFREMENPYALGSIGFFVAMSVYLSRNFARANRKIAEQDIAQHLLEAENARQAEELEAARRLQLSMLPKTLPQHPHLDIAVYMKTATEVGGDYYDFKRHEDGALTVVIGDATGHGMQAGTMVSATKSLFHALAEEPQPIRFLKKAAKAIRAMGLKKMFMALTIARFKDHHLEIAAAGMPFPLVYRAANSQVEAIVLKGMPLGALADFPYQSRKLRLNPGDTVLLMSDGLEEMFNPQNETLGDAQVQAAFAELAADSPQAIIKHLKNVGAVWADGRAQQDDVTFVVVKVR